MRQMLLEGTDLGVECPICGSETVVRTAENEHQFLGCTRWPDCNGTRAIPASALLATPVEYYRSEYKDERVILVVVDPETREKYQVRLTATKVLRLVADMLKVRM